MKEYAHLFHVGKYIVSMVAVSTKAGTGWSSSSIRFTGSWKFSPGNFWMVESVTIILLGNVAIVFLENEGV